jgi:predicted PurR-regulated permease PerM
MNDLEFYYGIFERELQRRRSLDSLINLPLAGISLLAGLVYFIFTKHEFDKSDTYSYILGFCLVVSFILLVIAVVFLAKSFNNLFKSNTYLNLPLTSQLRDYQLELKQHHESNKQEYKEAFEKYLITKYIEYSDDHIKINDRRSNELYYSKSCIIGSALLILIALIVYLISQFI